MLQNFDPTKEEDQDEAVFAATFTHFEKRAGRRVGHKKVEENYFIELEKREKAEAERRSIENKRLKNNEMLDARFKEIAAESNILKQKMSGDMAEVEKAKLQQ